MPVRAEAGRPFAASSAKTGKLLCQCCPSRLPYPLLLYAGPRLHNPNGRCAAINGLVEKCPTFCIALLGRLRCSPSDCPTGRLAGREAADPEGLRLAPHPLTRACTFSLRVSGDPVLFGARKASNARTDEIRSDPFGPRVRPPLLRSSRFPSTNILVQRLDRSPERISHGKAPPKYSYARNILLGVHTFEVLIVPIQKMTSADSRLAAVPHAMMGILLCPGGHSLSRIDGRLPATCSRFVSSRLYPATVLATQKTFKTIKH